MEFRAAFGYDVEAASNAAVVVNDLPSMTVQSHAADCDITKLVKMMEAGAPPRDLRPPMYGDFTGITDYKSALLAVGQAYDQFMEFPASLRARFDNDPQKLLDFMEDAGNYDEALKLGLVKERSSGGAGDKVAGGDKFVPPVQSNESGRPRDAGRDSRSEPAGAGGARGDRPAQAGDDRRVGEAVGSPGPPRT